MQIYISKERDAITWEVRSTHDSNPKNWFSFDLVAELLGHNVDTGTMNTANAVLLSESLKEIISRFKEKQAPTTLKKLNQPKAERIKRI